MLTRIFVAVLLVVGAGVAAVGARGADPPAAPTITSGPASPTNSQTAVFEWAVQEGLTYQCRLDDAPFAECTSPFSDVPPEGTHVFQVKAVDSSLIESEPATYTWTIDLTAPETSIVSHPTNPSNDVSPEFGFTSSEAGSTFECKLDSASFADCVSPQSVSVSAGTRTFSVRATDEAGNVDLTPVSYTWTVDTTAPATPQLRSPRPSDPSNEATPRFRWVVEAGVTYVCTVDETAEPCTDPYTTDPLSEGTHTFELRAKDPAGNLSAPATWSWTIDLTPPSDVTGTPDRAPDANGWYNHAVTVVFTTTDPTATCTSALYSGPDNGSASVQGTCTDPAGNPAQATFALKFDATAPSNVSGAPTGTPINGWYASPVVVTFTGTDATSGIQSCTAATYSGPDGTGVSVEGTCTDAAANVSALAFSSTFKYDGTAPEVSLTAPANGSATSDTTPRFTGTTNNGPADLNTVTVSSLSGPTPITLVAPVAADGSWSVSPADQLAPGVYQVQGTQTDEVGRSDTSPVHTFTIDPTLPGVQISSPAHGTVTTNKSLPISGTAGVGASFEPVVNVSVYSGTSTAGTPLLELSAPVLSGSWSAVSSSLADGVYTLVAEQSDLAGGTASDSVAVEIDTIPPAPLTGATAVSGYGYVKLHWTRPLSWETTDKVVITKKHGSLAPTIVYQGTGTLFKDGRVKNGTTYTYTLLPRDAVGNQGASLSKRARPTGFLAPRHGAHVLDPPLVRWVDVPKSTYANIQLYLVTSVGIKKIWSVWPLADKLQLKARWVYKGRVYRLRADRRYRVYGWPGFHALSDHDYGEWFGWVEFTYR